MRKGRSHTDDRFGAAWCEIRNKIRQSGLPWAMVKGPIGSCIQHMAQLGWDTITPTKWMDPDGELWIDTNNSKGGGLLATVSELITKRIWDKASRHYCGKGLEPQRMPNGKWRQGPDFKVARQHFRWRFHGRILLNPCFPQCFMTFPRLRCNNLSGD